MIEQEISHRTLFGGTSSVVTKLTQKFKEIRKPLIIMERVKGIEPSSQPWEGHILPLNHTRAPISLSQFQIAGKLEICSKIKEGAGQNYSFRPPTGGNR